MNVISVINYKGGVGKTTLTANIAAELAWRGLNILLIDLDPQASLTFSFITPDVRLKYIEGALKSLESWALEKGFSSIHMTLPPLIYHDSFIAKQINCLWREGYMISKFDFITKLLKDIQQFSP